MGWDLPRVWASERNYQDPFQSCLRYFSPVNSVLRESERIGRPRLGVNYTTRLRIKARPRCR